MNNEDFFQLESQSPFLTDTEMNNYIEESEDLYTDFGDPGRNPDVAQVSEEIFYESDRAQINDDKLLPGPTDEIYNELESGSFAVSTFDFNKRHAEIVLDAMNSGFVGSAFGSKEQLQSIVNGNKVLEVDPGKQIIQILPLISHISAMAKRMNFNDIIIGSFIRGRNNSGKCVGHCEGRCIDINFKGGSFDLPGAVRMVINIFNYLLSLDPGLRSNLGIGLPLQGEFFGRVNIEKFRSVSPDLIKNLELKKIIPQLGFLFPDNDNHLHIQIRLNQPYPLAKPESESANIEMKEIVTQHFYEDHFETEDFIQDEISEDEYTRDPILRSRYASIQAYRDIRAVVTGWGVSNPALYISGCIQDWNNSSNSVRMHFGSFDGNPRTSYLNLKRLYAVKGISNLAVYIASSIVNITFFSRRTPGHKDLRTALDATARNLISLGKNYSLENGTWSFVPRTFNDNINMLSNHALGKAIDINPGNNPHIKDNREFLIIDTVCRSVLPNGLLATSDPVTLAAASNHFRRAFNESWISQQRDPTIISAINGKRSSLDLYSSKGFFNLDVALVNELIRSGLKWGGSWRDSKDFMHFEL